MRQTVRFLAQSLTRFRTTGAVLPSSAKLARAVADAVPPLDSGAVIVELGPGTGVLTRELLRRFPRHHLIAVEFNPVFAERLRRELPQADIVTGCASRLRPILADLGIATEDVGAVVSGLPLLSLPRDLRESIVDSVSDILSPGRRFVQFTYSKRAWSRNAPVGFKLEKTRRVWLNVPPASVLPFTRVAASSAAVAVA